MAKQVSIILEGKTYPIKFGYGAVRALGKYLKQETYDGTLSQLGKLFNSLANQEKKGSTLSFEVLDTLGYLILAGIDYAHNDTAPHLVCLEKIVEAVLADVKIISPIVEAFVEVMPKAQPQGKQKAPKKKGA